MSLNEIVGGSPYGATTAAGGQCKLIVQTANKLLGA